jgi:DNA repair protein RecN (Recombination protein N)
MDEIARVASGGELSRLMLAIKSLVSGKRYTPTLIFDEIDTGVSGEIAAKVGRIMASMSKKVQVISITHLPQIAGKANQHLLVYKTEDIDRTKSEIIQLNDLQRIEEIARMLSDDTITEASRSAAKELIKSN